MKLNGLGSITAGGKRIVKIAQVSVVRRAKWLSLFTRKPILKFRSNPSNHAANEQIIVGADLRVRPDDCDHSGAPLSMSPTRY